MFIIKKDTKPHHLGISFPDAVLSSPKNRLPDYPVQAVTFTFFEKY
jgi:hypothetical protein